MGETWETIIRVAIAIGIAVFMWSVSSSMELIAKALTRLADAQEAGRAAPPSAGNERPPAPPV
jgi:hypothetical protein